MSRFDPSQLDTLLLSRARLGILSAVIGGDEVEFTYLRDTLGLSDGNLSVQLRKLEEAKYITIRKFFVERKPRTICRITPKGRKAMEGLLKHFEALLESGSGGSGTQTKGR